MKVVRMFSIALAFAALGQIVFVIAAGLDSLYGGGLVIVPRLHDVSTTIGLPLAAAFAGAVWFKVRRV
jgi:hypothetical protein